MSILQNQIRLVVELKKCLDLLDMRTFRTTSQKNLQERMERLKGEKEKYQHLKSTLYEDMKDGLVSKEDYVDIKTSYDERIKSAEDALVQLQREIEELKLDSSGKLPWMEDFLSNSNITKLSRNVVVKLVEKIIIHEDKRIEVKLFYSDKINMFLEDLKEFDAHVQSEVQKYSNKQARKAFSDGIAVGLAAGLLL